MLHSLIGVSNLLPIQAAILDNVPEALLWLGGIFIALVVFLAVFRRLPVLVSGLAKTALVILFLCGVVMGSYFLFFDRCEILANYDDGSSVRLIGVCREVRISPEGNGRRASFLLRDPTGVSRVVTTSGAPREGSFLYLLGRKGTFDDDNTFIESDYQFSPF